MEKYKKNPVEEIVEAEQFTGSVEPLEEGAEDKRTVRMSDDGKPYVQTKAGPLWVTVGDYLVKAEDGAMRVMSAEAFNAAYTLHAPPVEAGAPE